MNNLRLLTGLLMVALSSLWVRLSAQTVMTLDEIFGTAETQSAQIRPAITASREAGQEVAVARNGLLPDINASLSLSYIGDGFTTERNFSDYQRAPIPHFGNNVSLEVTQPVYTGGSVSCAVELAGLKSTAAGYAADLQRNNIRFRLAGFYLDMYKYFGLRRVVEANIAAASKMLAEMQARYEQGTVLKNDITRYELLVSNLGLQLIRINNTIEILNNNLVVTAGLPAGTIVVPDTTMLERSLPLAGENWWQNEARLNSPSLRLAAKSLDISRKTEALVRAGRRPKVALKAGWCMDGPILVEVPPIDRNLSYWYVGLGVTYNISSLYKSNKSLAKSRIATQRAAEELDAAQENISLAVRADYIRYREAYEELTMREKSVELAGRNYNTASTRYSAGMALITDMLDAANARLDAEQQLVNAQIDIIYYYYKLLFTTGKI